MLTFLRRARVAGDDAGISLIEVVIATTVGLVIVLAAGKFLTNAIQSSAAGSTAANTNTLARTAFDNAAAALTYADSPSAAGTSTGRVAAMSTNSVSFFANINNRATATTGTGNTTPITLAVVSGQLVEYRYAPTWSSTATAFATTPTATLSLAGCATVAGNDCTSSVQLASAGFTAYMSCPTGTPTASPSATATATATPSPLTPGLCQLTLPVDGSNASAATNNAVVAVGISLTMRGPGNAPETYSTVIPLSPAVSS